MLICLVQNIDDYNNDLRVMFMAFYMGVKIVTPESIEKKPELLCEVTELVQAEFLPEATEIRVAAWDALMPEQERRAYLQTKAWETIEPQIRLDRDYRDRKGFRNELKLALYRLLKERTGKTLPWGSLTGVRPVKIAMEAVSRGASDEEIRSLYETAYAASPAKADVCIRIARREKEIIETIDEGNSYCLYVGIPFCPTRCLYCSFTSYPIAAYRNKVDAYLDALEREMRETSAYMKEKKLISVYIGGGTPSSIDAAQIDRLFTAISASYDLSDLREWTVEAGRPDSTTPEKLQVMKRHGITRVSINPQTMNAETLKLIGRAHTPEQTEEAFARARTAGFDNINMDLIVGLPNEDAAAVSRTLARVKKLAPESLTVHTLAVKRAANLKQELAHYRFAGDVDAQLALAEETAAELSLRPYYLYRQKNMAGNLENVGYARHGLECLYNILIMEERTDILGIGAGSSSKRILRAGGTDPATGETVRGTRIDRVENCKNVDGYIGRLDEMIERKRRAFAK